MDEKITISFGNLKVVDEEEVSESQALTNLPPELLMKILSYLSTYAFLAQLPKTIVVKSTSDLLRNVALVSKQFHKYIQEPWVHRVVSFSRLSDHAKAFEFLTKSNQIEKLVITNPDLKTWSTSLDKWNTETEEEHDFDAEGLIMAACEHPHLSIVVSSVKVSLSMQKEILKLKKLRNFDFYIDMKRTVNPANNNGNNNNNINSIESFVKVETESFVKVRSRDELINLSNMSRNKVELHILATGYKFSPEDCKKAFEDKQLPSVKILKVCNYSKYTGDLITEAVKACPNLMKLEVFAISFQTLAPLPVILAKCRKLEVVIISTYKFSPDANFVPELFVTFPKMLFVIVAVSDENKKAARYLVRGNRKFINEMKIAKKASSAAK